VSIWTVVIGLANQQQRVVNGPSPAAKTAVVATPPVAAPVLSRAAGWPRGDATEPLDNVILKNDGTMGQHGQ